jgi:hypothetical protein
MNQQAAEARGAQGEARVDQLLGELSAEFGFTHASDLLFDFNGKTTQIDHVIIDRCGILVIETKAYSALLKGTSDDHQWTACYKNGDHHSLQNPLRQNDTHRKILGELLFQYGRPLSENYIQSLVVFANGALQGLELSGVDPMRVVEFDGLNEYLRTRPDFQFSPTELSQDTQNDLAGFIQSQNRRQDPEVWARHLEYAKARKAGRRATGQKRQSRPRTYDRRPYPYRPSPSSQAAGRQDLARLVAAIAVLAVVAVLGYFGLVALLTAQANAQQVAVVRARIPQSAMPEDKPTVARALQRLQSAAPNVYQSLPDREHPIVTMTDGLTKFTWADVSRTSKSSAKVRSVSITLDADGQLVGVDARR